MIRQQQEAYKFEGVDETEIHPRDRKKRKLQEDEQVCDILQMQRVQFKLTSSLQETPEAQEAPPKYRCLRDLYSSRRRQR